MITLSTGAVLDKDFDIGDYVDGRIHHTRGWLSTFHPCRFCMNERCRRSQYGQCDDEYLSKWLDWKGAQGTLENYGVKS